MPDMSDRTPDGGWTMPLLPESYLADAPQLAAELAALDTLFEAARLSLDALRDARMVDTAMGAALDALGQLVGVPRLAAESDDDYRARIPATALHGLAASTGPAMQALLQGAFGVPASVIDAATPGRFYVTLYAATPRYAAVMPLVRQVKAAGTSPVGRMLFPLPGGADGRVGGIRLGDAVLGDGSAYVPLPN